MLQESVVGCDSLLNLLVGCWEGGKHAPVSHFRDNLINLGLTEKLGEGGLGGWHCWIYLLGELRSALGCWRLLLLGSHVVGHVGVGVTKSSHVQRGQLLTEESPGGRRSIIACRSCSNHMLLCLVLHQLRLMTCSRILTNKIRRLRWISGRSHLLLRRLTHLHLNRVRCLLLERLVWRSKRVTHVVDCNRVCAEFRLALI